LGEGLGPGHGLQQGQGALIGPGIQQPPLIAVTQGKGQGPLGGPNGLDKSLAGDPGQLPLHGGRTRETGQALRLRPDAMTVKGEGPGRAQAAPADGARGVELDLPILPIRTNGTPQIALDDLDDAQKGVEAPLGVAPDGGHEEAAASFARNWSMMA
jgi:hypothetical protein